MGATVFSRETVSTVSVNPPSIADQTRGSIDVTIAGVAVGDVVVFEPADDLNAGLVYGGCRITAADTVRIYLFNGSGGTLNDGATTWRYCWTDRTP